MAAITICVVGMSLELLELVAPAVFEKSTVLLTASSYLVYAQWIVVLGAIALLWLTYRLARNLHALAPNKLSMSPIYAIAMFIVPVVSLFMPPQVIESIERETQIAAGAKIEKRTVIGWWWTTCIFASLIGGVAQSLMANSGAFDPTALFDGRAYEVALAADVIGGAIAVVSWLLTMRVFGPLAAMQSGLIRTGSITSA